MGTLTDKTLLTTDDMTKILKVPTQTICALTRKGRLPGFKVGREWRYDPDTVEEWIDRGGKTLETTVS